MLIAFVGTPCSGKTTTAARLFADLKDAGHPAEFIPEEARRYIAVRRLNGDTRPLIDSNQVDIMSIQMESERLMGLSSPDSVVVADSSAVNALLYMSPEFRGTPSIQHAALAAASRYDVVFRCHPVRPGSQYDPNRVHSFDESLKLDAEVEPLLEALGIRYVSLFGPQKMRAQKAYGAVLEAIVNQVAR
jgi:predicted ATPase